LIFKKKTAPLKKLLVCSAVICSSLTENMVAFSGDWRLTEISSRSDNLTNKQAINQVRV